MNMQTSSGRWDIHSLEALTVYQLHHQRIYDFYLVFQFFPTWGLLIWRYPSPQKFSILLRKKTNENQVYEFRNPSHFCLERCPSQSRACARCQAAGIHVMISALCIKVGDLPRVIYSSVYPATFFLIASHLWGDRGCNQMAPGWMVPHWWAPRSLVLDPGGAKTLSQGGRVTGGKVWFMRVGTPPAISIIRWTEPIREGSHIGLVVQRVWRNTSPVICKRWYAVEEDWAINLFRTLSFLWKKYNCMVSNLWRRYD